IVPLYAVQDFPERNLRLLCMPYLGGATLHRLLEALRTVPLGQRTGRHLLAALDEIQAAVPVALPGRGPARRFLDQASYVQAVCGVGICLAEGLHSAPQRGLAPLDLKPPNVLLAADGTPMLLDFHLAREPLEAGAPPPEWLGGTPGYMAPEQHAAVVATR